MTPDPLLLLIIYNQTSLIFYLSGSWQVFLIQLCHTWLSNGALRFFWQGLRNGHLFQFYGFIYETGHVRKGQIS